jgi:NitT/TauT family transport system substrate-binding protein
LKFSRFSRSVSGFASVLAVTLLAAACGGAAPAQPKPAATAPAASSPSGSTAATAGAGSGLVTVKVSQPVTSLSQMELYVALSRGYFKQEGLNIDRVSFHGGGPDAAALLRGDVQFDWTPDSYYIDLLAHGKKVLNVMNVQDKSIITWAISKQVAQRLGITAQTPLAQRLRDLRGLRIGITKPGALTDKLARYYVKRAGLVAGKDVKIVPVGSGSEAQAALQKGAVDVLVVSVPQPELAVQRGVAVEFMGVGADPQLNDFLMNSIHVLPAYAKAHPDVVRRFVAAVRKAVAWEQTATPSQIAAAVKPFLSSYSQPLLVAGVTQVKKAINPTGAETRAAAANTLAVVGTAGVTADQVFGEFDGQFLK